MNQWWKHKSGLLIAMAILIFSGLIGCSSQNETAKHTDIQKEQKHTGPETNPMSGDLRETTANIDEMPNFLKNFDPRVTDVYKVAAKHADILDEMPCYCGCGKSANHKSNLDCFIHEFKHGKVVWDSHGTMCGTCMDIALESAMMKSEGKSKLEIRKIIDQKYNKGYAPPTPTPMPTS
ncbi:PCYCGC motif-containing (lipo)protein [Thermoflavimicrobium daqui]|jgi:hypothetical protein|uniref:Lipoprotein n=1 Tax=Thermoflavimicrobium daqui TaxID=2137476 RepID=A0A364K3S1_9BACL|nr:PCYCGC motif-containing (lipo)protein [Thermoflavimicrobium daqui]RAL24024.1 hypothetical protein DL897_09980 [Thermoflavimicrobium daqui]